MDHQNQHYIKYLKYKSKYTQLKLEKNNFIGGYSDDNYDPDFARKVFYKSKPLTKTEINIKK